MKRYGRPRSIVTDRLRSYRSAMKVIGNAADQECGRWLNNRAENTHQPFRRREQAMQRFKAVRTLQKFAAAHASIHNHFNHDRHLNRRDIFQAEPFCCPGRVASTRGLNASDQHPLQGRSGLSDNALFGAAFSGSPRSGFAGFAPSHMAHLLFAGLLQFRFLLAKVAF